MSANRCPVCRAGFRAEPECRRCGADLSPLLRLAAASYGLREKARDHLLAGRPHLALEPAEHAQALHSTPTGEALVRLARVARSLDARVP